MASEMPRQRRRATATPSIFVSTGSTSSDVLLAPALEELRRRGWKGELVGVGGPRLGAIGLRQLFDPTPASSVGLFAGVQAIVRFAGSAVRTYCRVRNLFRTTPPRLAILVDNPGVNLPYLSLARHYRIPVLYYGPPEPWSLFAPTMGRIARQADVIAALYPDQARAYTAAGGRVHWVGHPAVDLLGEWSRPCTDPGAEPTIGLFPGSRRPEVNDLLPHLRDAAALLRRAEPGARFVTCAANATVARIIGKHLAGWATPVELFHGDSYRALARCDVLLTCSGTATLEAAILGVPMVAMYQIHHWIDRLLQRLLLNRADNPFGSLPNLLGQRHIIPELLNEEITPERLAAEGVALLRDPNRRRQMIEGLAEVRRVLGPVGTIDRVADLIQTMLSDLPGAKALCHRSPLRRAAVAAPSSSR